MSTVEAKPKSYAMPKPYIGQSVLYYPDGFKDARPGQVATVFGLSRTGQSAQISIIGSTEVKPSCRHISDPRLEISEDQRAEGAWDFLDEHYELQRLKSTIEAMGDGGVELPNSDMTKALQEEVVKIKKELAVLKKAFDNYVKQNAG